MLLQLTLVGKVVLLISLMLTMLSSYLLLTYTKKKYPTTYFSFYDEPFGPQFIEPAARMIREAIKNSHPEDKKYSVYVWLFRVSFILIFVSLFV